MEFRDLSILKKKDANNSDLHSFSTVNYDINNLAGKIHATKSAKVNVLSLKKIKAKVV